MNLLKWLYPGMRVKRWLALALAGLVLAAVGLDLLSGGRLAGNFATAINQFGLLFKEGFYQRGLFGFLVFAAGLVILGNGLLKTFYSLAAALMPEQEKQVADIIYARRNLRRGPKIVVIGGGTGLSVLLRGLKKYTSNLTAVVAVTDDGGSSGRLRGELGILPPGDIRNCLVALADKEPLMEVLLQYRFPAGKLAGHNVGNLLLAALNDVSGGFKQAVQGLSKVLAVRGQVLPVTLADVALCAELADGTVVQGESNIPRSLQPVQRVFLKPARCFPPHEVLAAIREADAVVLGPGSLYTSIIPNLLVRGIPEALAKSRAVKIYVCNLMTQPGETIGYTVCDHLKAIFDHAGQVVDCVVVNTGPMPSRLLDRYRQEGAEPVEPILAEIKKLGVLAVTENLVMQTEAIRHHPEKLALTVLRMIFATRHRIERVSYLNNYRK
ncbi:MAG: YvcK family protein [Peptococcaceae bacterium]|nr:MAG: YvcK family protein [Peptococcaceae bacterium]